MTGNLTAGRNYTATIEAINYKGPSTPVGLSQVQPQQYSALPGQVTTPAVPLRASPVHYA